MASNLVVNLDFGQSDGKLIQLGSVVQRRGVEILQGILYDKATVAHIDRPTSAVSLLPGESASLFRRVGVDDSRTFISDNVVYSGTELFLFPYRGIYRIKVRVIYSEAQPVTGDLILQVNTADGGLLDQRTAILRNGPSFGPIILDYIVQATALVSVVLTNQTNQTVTVIDNNPFGVNTFVEAVYLGSL